MIAGCIFNGYCWLAVEISCVLIVIIIFILLRSVLFLFSENCDYSVISVQFKRRCLPNA